MRDLGRLFRAAALRHPEAAALVENGQVVRYGQLFDDAARLAAALAAAGHRPGERVLVRLRNGLDFARTYWACQLAGLAIAPVNWRLSDGEAHEAAARIAASARVEAIGEDTVIASRWREGRTLADLIARADPSASPLAGPETTSTILFTSGTTGTPKGVPRTHGQEIAAALGHIVQNELRIGDKTLGVMPLYHTMGLKTLIIAVLLNGLYVATDRFDAEAALELIETHEVTNLSLAPTLYVDLLAALAGRSSVPRVEVCTYAGASMVADVAAAVAEAFRPRRFVNQYGSTEIYSIAANPHARAKPWAVGRPGLHGAVRVVPFGREEPERSLAVGEEGEVAASLDNAEAFSGYLEHPDADVKAMRDGWYLTGDAGYVDDDGDLVLLGRVDDVINTGGELVGPLWVEDCLTAHPQVIEAAVFGVPDPRWGEVVAAALRVAGELTADQIDAFVRTQPLLPHERPRRIFFVDAIPRTATGKPSRRLAKEAVT